MGSSASWQRERELLGASAVYPGHPVTLALLITHAYPDLASADAVTEHGWAAAVGSSEIPGGGGEVNVALALLRKVAAGLPVEEAIAWGDERWTASAAGGHHDRVAPGQAQADAAKALLIERLATWPLTLPPAPAVAA